MDGHDLALLLSSGKIDGYSIANKAIELAETDPSFITVTRERALREAENSQERLSSGNSCSPLDGVPIAVKDLFDVENTVTTAGSLVLAQRPPKSQDARVVQRISQAGAVLVGKTNLSELAFSGLGINPHYGTPFKPDTRNRRLIPGGSSSGSAVAVAKGIVPIALGTDTSGSVRVPAAFCGVIGYKASSKRYSHHGMTALSPTLDSIGILAHSMRDILVMDQLMGGPSLASPPATGIRLLVPQGELLDDCDVEVRSRFEATLQHLASHGVIIEHRRVSALDDAQRMMDQNTTIVGVEAYNEYKYLLEPSTRDRIDPGILRRLTNAAQNHHRAGPVYQAMNALRQQLRREVGESFLACPTVRHTAPEIKPLLENDEMYDQVNRRSLRTTMLLSYLGMPGISFPIGPPDEDSVGLLASAPVNEDGRLLTVADSLFSLL
ncbi:amidase family protein [Streptomyces asoensis]|uniref:amidase family protein n=1 Tax=Streptomyces asoensis TaxID=249586 RepID=UPI0033E9DD51